MRWVFSISRRRNLNRNGFLLFMQVRVVMPSKLNPNDISFQILPGEFAALADHISMSRTFLRN